MGIGTTAAVVGGGLASAGLGFAGAHEQAGAAQSAAQLQAQEAQNALNFQEQQWQTQQHNLAPWLNAGTQAVTTLGNLLSKPGQGLLAPWTGTFQAPTAAQAAATPGYQFALQQGQNAIQNSAAARGTLLSGGTLKALDQYSQGLADTNYQQVYNNAFQQYLQNYNQFQQNQLNQYNRLAGLAGTGQQAGTTLGQLGQSAANNVANTYLTAGQQIGQNINNAAAATASGYTAAGNAAAGLPSTLFLYQLLNQGGGGGGVYSNQIGWNQSNPWASGSGGNIYPPTGTPGVVGVPPS
jgi:hypothetical protein